MDDLSLKLRRENISRIVKIAGGAITCLIIAPLTFFILQGLLGMAALAVAGIIGFVMLQLTPWFSDVIANLRMKLVMAEASRNPIETMRNLYISNMRTIEAKDAKIVEFAAGLSDYADKMYGFAKKYPEEAIRYAEVKNKMQRVLDRQKSKQQLAKQAAEEYRNNIEKAQAIYNMACAAQNVAELGGNVEKQVFDDIKNQVAFDSVNHKFNSAVAALALEADTTADFSLPLAITQKSLEEKAG